ncbi:MAG TPA: proteinase inhibitor I4 serpin [Cyanobacteria bacterium UBA8803]|nr:proteinase inhibitor I4 serpin [Cyanobacteria bacterium UBA9273]HBL59285.1 proteinase inhibitor I4 serpin [Cyanobacteria bacterium UBA8803]
MNRNTLSRVTGIVVAGIVLVGLLGGFMASKIDALNSSKPGDPKIITQLPNPPVDTKLVEANTKFGFKLFSEILKQDSKRNVFVSPTSIAIALAMTYNGASGETQQAMAKALELQGLDLQDINQANLTLKASLENADPEVQLAIANSLWARQDIPFKPQFLERNQQFYQAKVTELDFTNPDAAGVINKWVQESTRGKIPQIIERIKPDDLLFLINAIYFKGNWTTEFDKGQTTERPFYLPEGTQKQHPMMSQSGRYRYYENDTFQAVSLPYGKGRLSLYVFLPRETNNLEAFQQQLTLENWQQWMSQFRQRDGSIVLPRFKLDYDIQLNNVLSAMGMELAFSDRADFSHMTPASVTIDEVKHKTFVEVNEEGTEAAAVTSVTIVPTSIAISEEPFRMVVDRPFFCAIRDNQTGTVLFMGSIREPK